MGHLGIGNEPEGGGLMRSTETRHCPKFDRITRRIFGLADDLDLNRLENALISLPKARRGSVALAERLFLDAVDGIRIRHLLEIGSNVGSHSRRFLAETNARLHCFEPNPRLFHCFSDLIASGRVDFNPYGLSNEAGLATFQVIDRLEGLEPGATHGMSSFEDVASSYAELQGDISVSRITAAKARADSYLEAANLNAARLALWVDVEGHAPSVLEGFGIKLRQADVVICEVESSPNYTGRPTADDVIEILESAGLELVYRDFQYHGRFNVVAMSPQALARPRSSVMDEIDVFIGHVGRHSAKS